MVIIKKDIEKMSKEWYSVIDYDKCINCDLCFNARMHGVFIQKEGKIEIIYSNGCITGYHSCKIICPVEAISCYGDQVIVDIDYDYENYFPDIICKGKLKVAFVCTHNACHSQMAEAVAKLEYKDVFESYSAGQN
jgi:NAD-dependent dihydropyrimidine dehydrogenase PreA subunit